MFDLVEGVLVPFRPRGEAFVAILCGELIENAGVGCEVGQEGGKITYETQEPSHFSGGGRYGPISDPVRFALVCLDAFGGDAMAEEMDCRAKQLCFLGVAV